MKKLLACAFMASLLLFVSCPDDSGDASSVSGVALDLTSLELTVGQTQRLNATVSPEDATNKTVSWSSSNTSFATVSRTGGLVTAQAAGVAVITVTTDDGSHTATCTVTVVELKVSPVAATLAVGETVQLTAIASETLVYTQFAWESDNTTVATVDNNGFVIANALGEANITVTAGAYSEVCTIIVVEISLGEHGGMSNMTAEAYFAEKKLYLGWNAGNSLDAPGGETAWGNPALNIELFKGVRRAGFTVLRLPNTWDTFIGAAPDYTINPARLARVAEVVDMAHSAGLVTIINIHHDDATSNTSGWLSIKDAAESTAQYEAITAKFTAVWKQIADYFKDYGDWLIFEPFNEVHNGTQGYGAWGWYGSIAEDITEADATIINNWNQVFTDTVRASGGNNTQRFLIVQPVCARVHQALVDSFTLPTDTATGKQIVSIHYYYPEAFALRGTTIAWAQTDTETNGGITTSARFAQFKDKYTSKGIPVIIGEAGATYQGRTGADGATANANRLAYSAYLAETAKANGMVPIIWDNGTISGSGTGEKFGLFNRTTGMPLVSTDGMDVDMGDVIGVMVNAVKD